MLENYKTLEHKINNIINFGTIKQAKDHKVVVELASGVVTPQLPYFVNYSGNAVVYFIPKVGDQVLILCPNGSIEKGIVMPSIYKGNPPQTSDDEWKLEFAKGSISYKAGELNITANTSVTIKSPKAKIDSDQIILGGEDGGDVVCTKHTCSFTGGPHTMGSSKIKGAL